MGNCERREQLVRLAVDGSSGCHLLKYLTNLMLSNTSIYILFLFFYFFDVTFTMDMERETLV